MAEQAKITHLDNQYTRQVQQHTNKTAVMKRRKRRALIICGFFIAVCLFLGTRIVQAQSAVRQTNVQIAHQQTKLARTKATNKQLSERVKLLNNKGYLENLIRSKYYYGKSGETIYSLPSDKASDVTAR